MIRLAVMSAIAVVSSAGHAETPARIAAKPVPACTLLRYSDLKSIPEKDTVNQSSSWPVKGGQASFCNYARGLIQVVLVTGSSPEQGYTDWLKRNLKGEIKKEPVSGLGRSAYYMTPRKNIAVVVVNGGSYTVGVTMVGGYGVTADQLKPKVMAFAKAAAARAR